MIIDSSLISRNFQLPVGIRVRCRCHGPGQRQSRDVPVMWHSHKMTTGSCWVMFCEALLERCSGSRRPARRRPRSSTPPPHLHHCFRGAARAGTGAGAAAAGAESGRPALRDPRRVIAGRRGGPSGGPGRAAQRPGGASRRRRWAGESRGYGVEKKILKIKPAVIATVAAVHGSGSRRSGYGRGGLARRPRRGFGAAGM